MFGFTSAGFSTTAQAWSQNAAQLEVFVYHQHNIIIVTYYSYWISFIIAEFQNWTSISIKLSTAWVFVLPAEQTPVCGWCEGAKVSMNEFHVQ